MSINADIRTAAVAALQPLSATILNAEPVVASEEIPAISVQTPAVLSGDRAIGDGVATATEDRQPRLGLMCVANGSTSAIALDQAETLAESAEAALKSDVNFLSQLQDFWFEEAEQTVYADSGVPTATVYVTFVTEVEL